MHRKDMIQMIVAIVVIVAAFFLAQAYLFPKPTPKPVANTPAANTPPANDQPPVIEDKTPSTQVSIAPTAKEEAYGFKPIDRAGAKVHALSNEFMTAYISERGAVMQSLVYIGAGGETVYLHTPDNPLDEPRKPLELIPQLDNAPDHVSSLALVLDDNDKWRNVSRWELVKDAPQPESGKSLTFRFPPSTGFEHSAESDGTVIYKTITLLPNTYRFDLNVRIENKGTAAVEKVVGLWGPVGMTNDAMRNSAEHSRIALYGSTESKRYVQFEDWATLREIKDEITDLNEDLAAEGRATHDWIDARTFDDITADDRYLTVHGFRTQYFLAFIAADPDNRDQRWSGQVLPINDYHAAVSLIAPKFTVTPGGEAHEVRMRFYAGPREKEILREAWLANPPADDEIKNQWIELATSGFFDVIAAPLIWLLGLLTDLVGAGFAIILLTLIVRFSLAPLSYRGQKSMAVYTQKMKVVKPKLDAIREKYDGKKGQEAQLKMLTETRTVMKEHNVGMLPLGGCLPMLIQLPIFIGLYRAFGAAFFLRQADFLWIHDLSLPDATIPGSFYVGEGFFGFLAHNGYLTINILPMLWIVLSVLQFKLQPKPDDPQQAAMQRNMAFIFPLMGLFFYGFAAGFSFYFIISSLYSIAESKLIKRNLIKQGVMPDPKNKPKVESDTKPDYHGAG